MRSEEFVFFTVLLTMAIGYFYNRGVIHRYWNRMIRRQENTQEEITMELI